MIIKVYTKNMALKKEVEIETNIIPRIGETILLETEKKTTHLVHDVVYSVTNHDLTPVVFCHEATPTHHRNPMLKEHGWI